MADRATEPTNSASPPRMETSAHAEAISVERVIKLVSEGRFRIPSFQRPLKWEGPERRLFLDSIYRGFPVGTLLLWKNPPNGSEAGKPLDEAAPAVATGDVYLVIDGQQRISTLWDALGRKPHARESRMVFDMRNDVFVSRPLTRDEVEGISPDAVTEDLPSVPLHIVLDAAALSEWVPKALPRETKRQYFELGKRIREYMLALYVVEDADMEVLRHVFDRVNTTGKPMSRDEVFNALVGSRVVSDGAAGLELVNARVRELGFGSLPPMTILKALEAIRGAKVGRLDPRTLDVREAEEDLLRTSSALRSVIGFFRDFAGVPHIEVCPYELPIVVLAKFFSLHEKPRERNLILLRRWFWRGSVAEQLGGASGSMQQHVDDVQDDEDASVQALLRRTGLPKGTGLSAESVLKASLATAAGQMVMCALLSRQPRNLETGERIDAADLFSAGKTDVLKPIVRRSGDPLGGSLANKLLHPSASRKPYQLILDSTDEGALISHGIDADAVQALRNGDLASFFQRRSQTFTRWVEEFLTHNAEPVRDDAPSIPALARRSA